jgi:hypothetical protein
MSSLLQDAIVDAKALREAALKNAETTVIDKYAEEVRQTLNRILEQEEGELGLEEPGLDEPMADLDQPLGDSLAGADLDAGTGEEVSADIPLAATDNFSDNEGENLNHLPKSGADVQVDIDLDALQEAVTQLQDEEEIDIGTEMIAELLGLDEQSQTGADDLYNVDETGTDDEEDDDDSAQALAGSAAAEEADSKTMKNAGLEEADITDALVDQIVEKLTVDMGADRSGWAGRPSDQLKYEMERELAHRRSTDVEEELDTLRKAQEELVFENKQLKETLEQYKQALNGLKEGLHDVNLSNARLLYTNRVLRNTSLNERQKTKIADAISKAGSVTEAKTIYHTLESTVESTPKRGPQSLSEAIGRHTTSVIRASRQESTSPDPMAERMKKLAGIK